MATTPASIAETVKRRTHADAFREFLRQAPEALSKDYIVEGLLGSGKGFATKRDLENRITQARAAGDISPQGKDRLMKNYRAQTGAATSSVKRINGGGGGGTAQAELSVLNVFMDDARDLAEDAVIDKSITRDQLLESLLMVTAAFNAVKKTHAS